MVVCRSNLVHYVMYFTLCFQGLDLLDSPTNIRFSYMIAKEVSHLNTKNNSQFCTTHLDHNKEQNYMYFLAVAKIPCFKS